jgi:transcription elongation factor GreA
MSDEKQYLSKEKYAELEKELAFLKAEKRKEIAEKLEYAKSLGDLSENAEYQEAREEQASVEDRILNLEAILKSAEIVSKKRGGTVGIGSKVTIKKGSERTERVYIIVGSEEANTAENKISNKSPIGAALIGQEKGAEVMCHTPGGDVKCKIIDVK